MYIKRKGSIAGPTFKIPLMGPFLQAINPKFESYLVQWASGPLSCVSVFHKFVIYLSTKETHHSYSHWKLQVCRARLRPRYCPQSVQVTFIRRAVHCSDCKRFAGSKGMGFPARQRPCGVPKGTHAVVYQQGHLYLPPRARQSFGTLF